jgi:hypothetical protein
VKICVNLHKDSAANGFDTNGTNARELRKMDGVLKPRGYGSGWGGMASKRRASRLSSGEGDSALLR